MEAKFGFLIFDGVEELDLTGPWEMISIWGKEYHGPNEIFTISQNASVVNCFHGLRIASDYSFCNCPTLDYLLVPGGMGTRKEVNNKALIDFIRLQADHCRCIASVCTGAFLLQAAGLLAGRKATTHWQSLNRLKQFPEVTVCEQRYVKDGAIWTSAGISAGMDMALALIADVSGKEIAGNVQLSAEYFPDPKQYIHVDKIENLPAYLKNTT